MVGVALAKSLYSIPTWTRTVALVREHAALREAIGGECPSVYAAYRFAAKLRAYSDLLDACIARVLDRLHRKNPDMGRALAIDGSDLPAYANGERYVSKNGPERERFSDPDASWGHRSAVSTRKGGGYYGYKVHAAVCTSSGLPLAWTVETASAAETNFALPLIDAARERGFAVRTAIMDKGYDNGPIHDGCMDRDLAPSRRFARPGGARCARRAQAAALRARRVDVSPERTTSPGRPSGAARPASASPARGG